MLTVVFGGTFDPVHAGHLAVARAAADILQAQVRLIPAQQPPHRPTPVASPTQRLEMLRLAIGSDPHLSIDERELHRPGPSYSIDTLASLRAETGSAAPLAMLVGADAFCGLPSWHRWQELFALAHIVVATRPGYAIETRAPLTEAVAGRWRADPATLAHQAYGLLVRLNVPEYPLSSSEIRCRLQAGEPVADALVPAVERYIRRQGLYGAKQAGVC